MTDKSHNEMIESLHKIVCLGDPERKIPPLWVSLEETRKWQEQHDKQHRRIVKGALGILSATIIAIVTSIAGIFR